MANESKLFGDAIMTGLGTEAAKEIKQLVSQILDGDMRKSESEVVKDAIRQFALKYSVKGSTIERVRKFMAMANRKSGKTLSQTIVEMRNEN